MSDLRQDQYAAHLPPDMKPQIVLPDLAVTLFPNGSMKLRAPNVLMFFTPEQVRAITDLLTQGMDKPCLNTF